jgi:anaerobic ribonucleoside-triphosphate reductase activating protein
VGLLDAVVFSGGEPTLQRGLARAIEDVRAMGFRAGLHTAGIYPGRLAPLLPRLNWIGLDVKAPFEDYPKVVGRRAAGASARDSLERVLDSPVEHEVRTTYHPALHDAAGLLELARMLSRMGVRRYVLQEFRATGCEDAALADFAPLLDEAFMAEVAPLFASFEWRRAASAAQ